MPKQSTSLICKTIAFLIVFIAPVSAKDAKVDFEKEIKELEQQIYAAISQIEISLSEINLKKENVVKVNNPEKEDMKKLEKENLLLKEKLNQLKSEHQKDLNSLNNIIEKLNSVLGEENV